MCCLSPQVIVEEREADAAKFESKLEALGQEVLASQAAVEDVARRLADAEEQATSSAGAAQAAERQLEEAVAELKSIRGQLQESEATSALLEEALAALRAGTCLHPTVLPRL
jgi:hypothetical protein